MTQVTVKKLLANAMQIAEDMKGEQIVHLDVQSMTSMTDHMLIITGTSSRHVKAIANEVALQAKHMGNRPLGVEGVDVGDWALVDLGSVLVHVMQAETREFYDLERLWDPELNSVSSIDTLLSDDTESLMPITS